MAIRGEPLPLAVVDLDAFERNVATVLAPIIASGKRLRVATKSVRCPELLSRIAACAGEHCIGYLTFTAAETAFHAAQGVKDLLLAYPTMQAADAVLLAQANRSSTAATVVDCPHHLPVLSEAATREGVTIPVAIDLDMSWRPVGELLHIGVRRSPLREPADVVALAQRISQTPGLRFHGVQAYEAQIAGLADRGPVPVFSPGTSSMVTGGSRWNPRWPSRSR